VQMEGVKIALIISAYYPAVLPPDDLAPVAVGRLTPHFHDIVIENVTATATKSAGAIVGLPEAPVVGVVLRNVSIHAPQGLTIGYAAVTADHLDVQVTSGKAITTLPSASLRTK